MVVASQGQSGSKTNQTAILILGALVIVSGVGLVVVLALHFQTGEQWKQEIDILASEKAKLHEDLNDKTSEIAKLVDNLDNKTTENSKLAAGLQKSQDEVAELKTKTNGWDTINMEKIQLNKTLMNKNAAYDNLVAEKAQLTLAWQKATEEITELERKKNDSYSEVKKLGEQLANANDTVKELQNKIESIPCKTSCEGLTLKEITIPGASTTQKNVSLDGDWIVIQRRMDGCLSFIKHWNDYVVGFGSPCREFWMGLESIHQLVKNGDYQLKIDMIEVGNGTRYYAQYSSFRIGPSSDNYTLTVSGYSGNATDALAPTGSLSWASASGRPFSTFDVDNDEAITLNCATLTGGGWWQNQCSSTELNARYGSVDETLGLSIICNTCPGRQQTQDILHHHVWLPTSKFVK